MKESCISSKRDTGYVKAKYIFKYGALCVLRSQQNANYTMKINWMRNNS